VSVPQSYDQLIGQARDQFRQWAAGMAHGGHRPAPRDLFNAGATLGVEQPAALLEHLTEVARHDPEIIGLGVKDDE
jgi:hypothetical protein